MQGLRGFALAVRLRAAGPAKAYPNEPAERPNLRALVARITHDPAHARFIKQLNDAAPGIVLCGGGAKGAYQLGAILALLDLGIVNYRAIAGTSVGGLNAVLLRKLLHARQSGSETARRDAVSLWTTLGPSQVLQAYWITIPKFLLSIPMLVSVARNYESIAEGLMGDVERTRWFEMLLRGLLVTALLTPLLMMGTVLVFLGPMSLWFVLPWFGVIIPWYWSVYAVLLLTTLFGLPYRRLFYRLGTFSSDPLKKRIHENLVGFPSGDPPIFCTVAVRSLVVQSLKPKMLYVPMYLPLIPEDLELTSRLLLSTTALPFVFTGPSIQSQRFTDGGVVDNTPVLALAPDAPTQVLIVYLDHTWARVERLHMRVCRDVMALVALRQEEDPGDVWRWLNRVKILPIIPSRNLGGIFRGTLNFSGSRAKKLMFLGYTDAVRQVSRLSAAASGRPRRTVVLGHHESIQLGRSERDR
jgi:hypothetical protein